MLHHTNECLPISASRLMVPRYLRGLLHLGKSSFATSINNQNTNPWFKKLIFWTAILSMPTYASLVGGNLQCLFVTWLPLRILRTTPVSPTHQTVKHHPRNPTVMKLKTVQDIHRTLFPLTTSWNFRVEPDLTISAIVMRNWYRTPCPGECHVFIHNYYYYCIHFPRCSDDTIIFPSFQPVSLFLRE